MSSHLLQGIFISVPKISRLNKHWQTLWRPTFLPSLKFRTNSILRLQKHHWLCVDMESFFFFLRKFNNIYRLILKVLKVITKLRVGRKSVRILQGYSQITENTTFRPNKQRPSINIRARLVPCLLWEGGDQPAAPRNNLHEELLIFIRAGEKHHIQAYVIYWLL